LAYQNGIEGRLTSAASNKTLSVRKFSGIPNVTGREIQPRGITGTGPTLENGRDGWSFDISICSFLRAAKLIRFSAAPPSIRTWYNLMLMMNGETSSGSYPARAMLLRQSEVSKLIDVSIHLWCDAAFGAGVAATTSAQILDDAMGGDVPRTSEHDVECLAALVVAGLRVRMAVYGLEVPFGLWEAQSVLLVLLGVFLLFALSLAGRCAVVALLLQLLMVLFHEFLDFPALLSIVVHRVVHWATRANVIASGGARHLRGLSPHPLRQQQLRRWELQPTAGYFRRPSSCCSCCYLPG
jgi:hypothetical protein